MRTHYHNAYHSVDFEDEGCTCNGCGDDLVCLWCDEAEIRREIEDEDRAEAERESGLRTIQIPVGDQYLSVQVERHLPETHVREIINQTVANYLNNELLPRLRKAWQGESLNG